MKSIKPFIIYALLHASTFHSSSERIRFDVDRPMTAEEIAAYKKAHPGYIIHPETYQETTVPHTVITRTLTLHAPWTESADMQARENWSDREKNLERAMREKRILNKQQDHAKIVPTVEPVSTTLLRNKLEWALAHDDVAKAKEAINEGAFVMSSDLLNYLGAASIHPELIQLLVAHKANINVTDAWGQTPLFFAHSQPELVKALLNAGADVNHKNLFGRTVLDFFRLISWPSNEQKIQLHESIKELLRHGAIVPDELKTKPVIKQLAREVRDEKIAKVRIKFDLDLLLGIGLGPYTYEYVE